MFQFQPHDAIVPKNIQVSKVIYYDGVTKDRFMETVQRVAEGVLLVHMETWQTPEGGTEGATPVWMNSLIFQVVDVLIL